MILGAFEQTDFRGRVAYRKIMVVWDSNNKLSVVKFPNYKISNYRKWNDIVQTHLYAIIVTYPHTLVCYSKLMDE